MSARIKPWRRWPGRWSMHPGRSCKPLADTVVTVIPCGSAGISLLTRDEQSFHWPAIAGAWKPHTGSGTPRDFGPCGDVLDRNCPLLFRHPERRYAYIRSNSPPIVECLLVPFYVDGRAVGTLWVATHDDAPTTHKFDNEDLRLLISIGSFASATHQSAELMTAMRSQAHERDGINRAIREVNEALVLSSLRQHELAEAAKQAEQAMRDTEIRYRRLFQTAKDGILILDAKTGEILDANAFMIGLLGQDLHDLVGRQLWEIGLFADIEANRAAFSKLQTQGYMRYDHLPVQKPNGEQTQVEFISNVYQEGSRLLAQCNVRDISLRATMEQQIRDQALAMADQNRRKDEFLAMLSHELRNPLAPIRSATHLLRMQAEGQENPLQRQAREVIERQVTSLTRLVSDLMEISRVVTGRIKMRLEILDMNQVVLHAVETARPLVDRQRHEIKVTLPPASVWIHADATRLEEIVVNLLANAAKYTDQGGRIDVSLEPSAEHVRLRVRDTGVGISAEMLPRVFDLFSQADRSLDHSQGGLGIGLSLVQRLVQLHGGTVSARSAGLGEGSEFVIELPTVAAPDAAPAVPAATIPVAKLPLRGMTILVVDDNVDACTMLANLLRLDGHVVQTAHTGPTALQAANASKPEVIILDIGLPLIDGYEVARRMRAEPSLKGTRLIALTGYGKESDVQLSHEAGFEVHFLKPVEFDDIQKLLAVWSAERNVALV